MSSMLRLGNAGRTRRSSRCTAVLRPGATRVRPTRRSRPSRLHPSPRPARREARSAPQAGCRSRARSRSGCVPRLLQSGPVPSARGAFCAACGAAVLWLIRKLLYSALPLMVSRELTTPGRRLSCLSPLVGCHAVFSWPIVSGSGGRAAPASTISYTTGHQGGVAWAQEEANTKTGPHCKQKLWMTCLCHLDLQEFCFSGYESFAPFMTFS